MTNETCSVCHRAAPRPVLICTMCTDTPTIYCETRCRDQDTSMHQNHDNIKIRQVVYRAGSLLQEIFYKFREAAFDMQIKKVEKRGEVLHVYEKEYRQTTGTGPYQFHGPLFRFPHDMVPDLKDKGKLLSMQACTDAIAYTVEVGELLFEGLVSTIEEAYFEGMKGSANTVRYFSNGEIDSRVYAHSALVIEAKDGEAYVLDIAGAQHNQFEAVVPFETFTTREATSMAQLHPHGHHRTRQSDVRNGLHPSYEHTDVRANQIVYLVQQHMLKAVDKWVSENDTSLQQIVRIDSEEMFEQAKESFLTKIGKEMMAFVEKRERNGRPLEPVPRLVGKPELGPNRCTVEPKGPGSRAYQKWKEDNKPSYNDEMRQFVGSFMAGGGKVMSGGKIIS